MFRYRLYTRDGDEIGEAQYAEIVRPGDEIIAEQNRRFRVFDLVPVEEEGSPFVGLLEVEAA